MPSQIDRAAARALVEAGYMPLAHYVELFGAKEHGGRGLPGEQPYPVVRSSTLRIEVPLSRPVPRLGPDDPRQ